MRSIRIGAVVGRKFQASRQLGVALGENGPHAAEIGQFAVVVA